MVFGNGTVEYDVFRCLLLFSINCVLYFMQQLHLYIIAAFHTHSIWKGRVAFLKDGHVTTAYTELRVVRCICVVW